MKNLFKNLMLVAVAAMAFTACTETNDEVNANVEKRVFKFIAGFADDTRSGFGDKVGTAYPSHWDGGEALKVYADGVAQEGVKIEDAEGHFSVELTGNPAQIDVYSPASAWDNTTEPTIPTEQTPRTNSVDPKAHILKAENVAVNSGVVTMSHAVAYGKMTVNAPSTFTISYVEVSFNDGTPYVIKADNVDNNTFWFATEPDVVSKFTVIAYNDKGKAVAKTVDVAAAGMTLKFNEGRVSTFSVSGLKAVVEQSSSDYTLVTDVANLAVGDKVIIVAADFDVAMSTNQKTNNRGQAVVTKIGDVITFDSDVQILTLEAGTKAGTFAFNTGSGYLYAASSSSNHLKTQTANNDNGSWTIEIGEKGVATIKAQGTNTRNWMRYNSATTNGQLFSCYGSGQADICIYKQAKVVGGDIMVVDPSFELDVTELSFEADGESKVVNVIPLNYFEAEVTATTDAEWLSIENDRYTYTVTAEENEAAERTATIKFSADGYKDVVVDVKQNTSIVESVTVAEFLAADEDATLYRLRGTITGLYGNETSAKSYGNFYLTDDTDTVIIYGLLTPEGEKQTQWTDAEIKVGDDIEVITVRTSYNGNAQGKDAIYVNHVSPGTRAFWSFDKDSVSFGYEGGTAEIKVDAYNLTEEVECVFEDGDLFEADYANGVLTIRAEANSSTEELNATLYVRSSGLEQIITISQAAYIESGDEVETVTESVDFSKQSYANGAAITEYVGGNFSIAFNKGSNNSNPPKYYASGTAIRCYGGNYFTISSEKTIVAIKLTYGSSDGTNAISTDAGTFVSPNWTGESTSVKFTIGGTSGNRRIKGIEVTYKK